MARLAAGPFWLGTNNDPSYLYLFNASYILAGIPPMFTDHPGTTLQLLMAGVIALFGPYPSEAALVAVTAYCAEWLLSLTWVLLMGLFFCSSWGLGRTILRVTGSLSAAMAAQAMGLFFLLNSGYTMPVLANVNAEALLVSLMNVYFSFLLLLDEERLPGYRRSFLLGIVAGACVVTKMTFLPFLALPFLLLGSWRRAAVYGAGVVLSVLMFTLPIWARFDKWRDWCFKLLFKTGIHGSGSDGLLIPAAWLKSFSAIVTADAFLFVMAAVALGLSFRAGAGRRWLRILALMIVIQAVFIAKQGALQYMAPATAAAGVLVGWLLQRIGDRRVRLALLSAGLIIFSAAAWAHQGRLRDARDDQQAFNSRIRRETAGGLLVGAYRASSPEFAVYFGHCMHHYKGLKVCYFRPYGPLMAKVYPQVYLYNYWTPWFASFDGPEPLEQIKHKYSRIYVHTTEINRMPSWLFKEVDRCKTGEKLYQLQ